MLFYLGTHTVSWLRTTDVPLFVSRRRLIRGKTLPVAQTPWVLDSGGFSELSLNGRWSITPFQYAAEVRRYADEIGQLQWAAPMDWMSEPLILAKTGLTTVDHQRRTIDNFIMLRSMLGEVIAPVLQGWERRDYLDHVEMYAERGIDLTTERIVGVGTVCRRQDTQEAEKILRTLAGYGLSLHGFGVKITGLRRYASILTSADSMAWSFDARRAAPYIGHTHKNCANCIDWALNWRLKVIGQMEQAA